MNQETGDCNGKYNHSETRKIRDQNYCHGAFYGFISFFIPLPNMQTLSNIQSHPFLYSPCLQFEILNNGTNFYKLGGNFFNSVFDLKIR